MFIGDIPAGVQFSGNIPGNIPMDIHAPPGIQSFALPSNLPAIPRMSPEEMEELRRRMAQSRIQPGPMPQPNFPPMQGGPYMPDPTPQPRFGSPLGGPYLPSPTSPTPRPSSVDLQGMYSRSGQTQPRFQPRIQPASSQPGARRMQLSRGGPSGRIRGLPAQSPASRILERSPVLGRQKSRFE